MGLIVIVNVFVCPWQLLAVAVTETVAVTGILELFIAVNAEILPEPLAPNPIDVLLFDQLYEVPITVPVKLIGAVIFPLHNAWSPG